MIVCHLTTAHDVFDIRIFQKECKSLTKKYEVHLVCKYNKDECVDNIYIHGVRCENTNRYLRMTKVVYLVLKKALEIDAEVYHFHDPELIPVGIYLLYKNKKVIYDVHEDYPAAILSKTWIPSIFRKTVSKIFKKIEEIVCPQFNNVITVHEDIAVRLKSYKKNVTVLHNYPLSGISSENIKKISEFVWLGGLSNIRGKKQIVEVFSTGKAKLNIIGKIEGGLNNNNNINVCGSFPVSEAYNKAEKYFAGLVTYLPEPNHVNALPNKLFEYMALGIAVIASDFPKWRKIIETAQCGILVDPENITSFKNAIKCMKENYQETIKMGENGRKAIRDHYRWEVEEQKLLEVYRELEYFEGVNK